MYKILFTPQYKYLKEDFFNCPEKIIAENTIQTYKNHENEKTAVFVVEFAGKRYVIKRYNIIGVGHFLKTCLRGTRGSRAWKFSHLLKQHNIATVEPVAFIEHQFGPLHGRAYMIYTYLDCPKGCEYLRGLTDDAVEIKLLFDNVARLVQQLKLAKLSHHDFHLGNMLIDNNKPILFDLDHMHSYTKASRAFNKAHAEDVNLFKWYLRDRPALAELFMECLSS